MIAFVQVYSAVALLQAALKRWCGSFSDALLKKLNLT